MLSQVDGGRACDSGLVENGVLRVVAASLLSRLGVVNPDCFRVALPARNEVPTELWDVVMFEATTTSRWHLFRPPLSRTSSPSSILRRLCCSAGSVASQLISSSDICITAVDENTSSILSSSVFWTTSVDTLSTKVHIVICRLLNKPHYATTFPYLIVNPHRPK